MTAEVYTQIGRIRTTDIPNRDAWNAAQIAVEGFHPLVDPLDNLPIVIIWDEGDYYVVDGDHLLACIAVTYGSETMVHFHPRVIGAAEKAAIIDYTADIKEETGVSDVLSLAVACSVGDFDSSDSHTSDEHVPHISMSQMNALTAPLSNTDLISYSPS